MTQFDIINQLLKSKNAINLLQDLINIHLRHFKHNSILVSFWLHQHCCCLFLDVLLMATMSCQVDFPVYCWDARCLVAHTGFWHCHHLFAVCFPEFKQDLLLRFIKFQVLFQESSQVVWTEILLDDRLKSLLGTIVEKLEIWFDFAAFEEVEEVLLWLRGH